MARETLLWFAYLLPLLYSVPVYLVAWSFVRGSFAPAAFLKTLAATYGLANRPVAGGIGVGLPLLFSISVVGTLIWALGEEIGWRGFLFPLLHKRYGFPGACWISGLLWAVWHYPGLIWADYNAGTNPVFAITWFTISVIAMAFIMGFLRVRSGSIWPCVLLHATHNTFVQGLFDALTARVGKASYITSEFGAGLALIMSATAWVVLSRGSLPRIVDKPLSVDSGKTK